MTWALPASAKPQSLPACRLCGFCPGLPQSGRQGRLDALKIVGCLESTEGTPLPLLFFSFSGNCRPLEEVNPLLLVAKWPLDLPPGVRESLPLGSLKLVLTSSFSGAALHHSPRALAHPAWI